MDISAWWVLGAFFVGGSMGALLVALMTIAETDGGSPAEQVRGTGIAPNHDAAPRWST